MIARCFLLGHDWEYGLWIQMLGSSWQAYGRQCARCGCVSMWNEWGNWPRQSRQLGPEPKEPANIHHARTA